MVVPPGRGSKRRPSRIGAGVATGRVYRDPVHGVGIDVGSTNVKVALVEESGVLVADASRPLHTVQGRDAVVQDPDALWSAIVEAVREVTTAHPHEAADVASVGVCSQYSSIVPVDTKGEAVGPIIMYLDRRGTDRCWEILDRHPEAFDEWVRRHGIPPVGAGLSLAHLLHTQLDQPDLHERTAAYLEVMDLVNLRLTGRAAATQCTMFASQLCDNRTVGVTTYDDELVRLAGVDPSRLPPLIPIDGVVGELGAGAASALGLPPGVPVRSAMNDTHAGAFATGTTGGGAERSSSRCGLVVGTTAVLIRPMDAMAVDLEREVLSMPAPAGRYVVMAENGIAGRAVERVLAMLSPGDDADGFVELAAALEASAPGAGGLMFLPWLAGSMSPSSSTDMRGGFIGMSLATTRNDVIRSCVEGVARNLRWLQPAVEGLAGGPATEVVFAGGAARSRAWAQVTADVLGCAVTVLERPEVAAARAVGMVAVRRTAGDDPTDIAIPVTARLEPTPGATAVHDRIQPLFEQAFTAVAPVCEALRP
jgi:xylulokinase